MKKGSGGSPALLIKHGRRMRIPSHSERLSNHIHGASSCFRSSYWEPPKGAASSVPVLMSRTSPSIWRPPPRGGLPTLRLRYTPRAQPVHPPARRPALLRSVHAAPVAVRRSGCPLLDCPRLIFVERLAGFAAPGRGNQPARPTRAELGSSVGGEDGSASPHAWP